MTRLKVRLYCGLVAVWTTMCLGACDELLADWRAQTAGADAVTNVAFQTRCLERRAARLAKTVALAKQWVYCRHYVMGGSFYAYTEALSDAENERTYVPMGSALCLATYKPNGLWDETELLVSKEGCFRDVDVSPDGKRILYAFKAHDRGDDFHLYEMELATRKVRQLTFGVGVADYEGCYLPDGRILFNSTRCMQIVDCWWTEVSTLYRCDADGSNITRIAFDQVHDNYPTLAEDGRILYTRWEYNDRSQMFTQILFGMNVDGTSQRAVYGANSWFPTTPLHARTVPGMPFVFATATGHHTFQPGKLVRIDLRETREEPHGVWQTAPLCRATPVRIDQYGQEGALSAYPYPIDTDSVVLSHLPEGWTRGKDGGLLRSRAAPFGLYWMDVHGNRELLVSRKARTAPCGRPVPVRVRNVVNRPSTMPDETRKSGTFFIQNVYQGAAMVGVPPGTVKSLRVVSLDYRPAGIGWNANGGLGGGGLSCTPPAIGNGTWDVKRVLGEVPVAADGSVVFDAPVRTPLFFMLLDAKGRMVQSMRSWTVLQPGECASCLGCHESVHQTPGYKADQKNPTGGRRLSLTLPARGFSFAKDVQPILDRRCVRCHDPAKNKNLPELTSRPVPDLQSKRTWTAAYLSLTHAKPRKPANGGQEWAGNTGHPVLNWINSGSEPTLLPPLSRGSCTSRLFTEKLDKGYAPGLTDAELRTLACWLDLGVPFCGDYEEGALWNAGDHATWRRCVQKRERFRTRNNCEK